MQRAFGLPLMLLITSSQLKIVREITVRCLLSLMEGQAKTDSYFSSDPKLAVESLKKRQHL